MAIVALGTANLSVDKLADLRQRSIPRFASTLRPQLLKHSDDQTLAAAVALDRAIEHMHPAATHDFDDWAVVSSTRYLGREAFAAVIDKYQIDGPWGVSVQAIPHTSPHAVASTLSLALGSHGPCLGAGAAVNKEPLALIAATTLLRRREIGGAWVIFSGWEGESTSDNATNAARCQAAGLAVIANEAVDLNHTMGQITVRCPDSPSAASTSIFSRSLIGWLAACRQAGAMCGCLSSSGVAIDIEWFATAQRKFSGDSYPRQPPRGIHAAFVHSPVMSTGD